MGDVNELALFAGAGGGLLATKHLLGWTTVCYVENGAYPVRVLQARIKDGLLDDAPIWGDARTFDGRPWARCVDIVTAGFPCQPFSVAGKQLGKDDERNLWPETIRIIREARPTVAFLENVPGIVSSGYIFTILNDLSESGYKAFPPLRLAARDIGANHKRERIWIVAHAKSQREMPVQQPRQRNGIEQSRQNVAHSPITRGRELPIRQGRQKQEKTHIDGCSEDMADTHGQRQQKQRAIGGQSQITSTKPPGDWRGWWLVEPRLGRVAHGVANRVDRVATIGEGQVPAVVASVWWLLTEGGT